MSVTHRLFEPRLLWRWTRLLVALTLIATALSAAPPAYAAGFTVTKIADTNDGACNADCSLREAIIAANTAPGADTIAIPGGTFTISLTPGPDENSGATGDFDITDPLTLVGAGAASTIIDGADADRIFDITPFGGCNCTVALSGMTIRNGKGFTDNFNVGGAIFIGPGTTVNLSNSTIADSEAVNATGGAIENRGTLNLTNVTLQNNTAKASGGAIYSVGSLAVTGSTFSGNQAESGGAIFVNTPSSSSTTISTSTFTGNRTVATAGGVNDDGGALAIDSDGSVTVTESTFTGNTSVNNGGAIYFNDSLTEGVVPTLTATYNRIVGNTAVVGSGLYQATGTATAENNWWGCNAGPTASPCNRVAGTADTNPWLVLTLSASPTTIPGGTTSAVTASFLLNSSGIPVGSGNLDALSGVATTFGSAVLGAVAPGTVPIGSGTASATYTAGATPGSGSATATVDSQSVSVSITVVNVSTTTTITGDTPDPSVVGQPVTVSYSVSTASGTPTGNVTVTDGVSSCTATVAAGSCALALTTLGVRTLTATYAGGPGFTTSTSASVAHTVNQASTTTTITSDVPDPSVVGQSVTVNFSVAVAAPGAGTPTGNVTVTDGTTSCTATVAAGACALTFTGVGTPTLTAMYAGDTNFTSSTSTGVSQTVTQASTITAITSDTPDPSVVNGAVTVSFNVTPVAPGAGTPTGNVTVSDGVDSCSATVVVGSCGITLSTVGSRTLTATYAGDANFAASTSADEAHVVVAASTTTTITSDTPDPSVVGETITVSFDVTSTAGTPTGTVTVTDGVDSCTNTVVVGSCAITLSTAGSRTLTATYAGDTNFAGSTSAGVAHTVSQASTTTTITGAAPSVTSPTQPLTVSFNVASVAPGAGAPTGTVTVTDGVDSCTATVAAGSCAITLTTPGNRTLTAMYAGDANFAASTSADTPQTVDGTAPNVTIDQATGQADPTAGSPLHFTAVFDEPVLDFTAADVTLGGTAGATTVVVTELAPNDGTTYDVTVSGMTASGTVSATIAAAVATDAVGNGNAASTSTDNTVTYILNAVPVGLADTYTTAADTLLSAGAPGVLGNDSDPNGDPLTAVLVTGPSHAASFTLNSDGSFSYMPVAGYGGPDSFTYTAQDSQAANSTAITVSITVTQVRPTLHRAFLPLVFTPLFKFSETDAAVPWNARNGMLP